MTKKKKLLILILIAITLIFDSFVLTGGMPVREKALITVLFDLSMLVLILSRDVLFGMADIVLHNKRLVLSLSKNDFKTRYAGSYFGIVWAFIQPVIMLLVYWFALDIGLKAGSTMDHPFILWLMAGLVPWFYFAEALGTGTNALMEYSYLVKKVVFKIDILPIVKVTSAIFIHLFFVTFIIIFQCFYGYYPDLYTVQVIYYIICMYAFILGLTYFTSAAVIFFRDLNQIISIILQVGIWATPIMWNIHDLMPRLDKVMKLNPVYYVVSGFRDSLLTKTWFWERPVWSMVFWFTVILLFVFGYKVFQRLKVHFADVL